MLSLVFGFILFLAGNSECGTPAPTASGANGDAYSASIDPASGFTNTRVGAYWPLKKSGSNYPAHTFANTVGGLPSAVPLHAADVYSAKGIDGTADEAVRFMGKDQSCLKVSGFTRSEDTCLRDPSTCQFTDPGTRYGLSLSVWVKLSPTFSTDSKYILDTGGNEVGGKGVAIYYQDSKDGKQFQQEFTVIVSTGTKYWKVILTGMLQYNVWQNLGLRWSPNNIYGLQVFVNRNPTAWKQYGNVAQVDTPIATQGSISIGCSSDGTQGMLGNVDELAVWFWRLDSDEAAGAAPPVPAGTQKQLVWLDGGDVDSVTKTVTTATNINTEPPGTLTGAPAAYTDAQAEKIDGNDDTTPAVEGDCNQMTCADTVNEIQEAQLTYPDYTGPELVNAIVRTANKAGDDGLSDEQLAPYENDIITSYLNAKVNAISNNAVPDTVTQYTEIVRVVSKLTEKEIYKDRWLKKAEEGKAGISAWMKILDDYLHTFAVKSQTNRAVIKETNQTIATIGRVLRDATDKRNLFIDYSLEKSSTREGYSLHSDKKLMGYWEGANDFFSLDPKLFLGWSDQWTSLNLVTKWYRQMHEHLPGYLDSRVQGPGVKDAKFFVASRVLSFTLSDNATLGNTFNKQYLSDYPLRFTVEHQKQQPDAIFLKGAVLCVHWQYNADKTKIGAWDPSTCSIIETNDTHTTCACAHLSDYAVIIEDVDAIDGVPNGAYILINILSVVSVICLLIMILVILINSELHYEIHIIHLNLAMALLAAMVFYGSTVLAHKNRIPCMVVSVFIHYFYTTSYVWFMILAHYLFRAITSGRLGNIVPKYSIVGWGVPALLVAIFAGIDVARYGVGRRCFGTLHDNFMYLYVGSFILFLFVCAPLMAVSLCNLRNHGVRDKEDWADIKMSFFGICIIWPLIFIIWMMAIPVYLVPQISQAYDYTFELFNALQGIVLFLVCGCMIKSFRNALCCRKTVEEQEPIIGEKELDEDGFPVMEGKRGVAEYFA